MAYAALVSLERVLEQFLDHDQDCKQKVRYLHENVVALVAFLDDYPEDAGFLLEAQIRDAANQAQDIIEYQISDEIRVDCACWGVIYCIRHVFLSIFSVHRVGRGGTRHELRNWKKLLLKLQGVMRELETIVKKVNHIKSSKRTKEATVSHSHGSISMSTSLRISPGDKDTIVGLEEELIEIKDRLSGGPDNLRIIPIVGMGGIGKTTLARCAYDDPLSMHHFDVRGWVTVSQDYGMEKILSGIIRSMNLSMIKNWIDDMSEEKLLEHLYKSLKGRRYLIVMDDVWDLNAWDLVRRTFPDDRNGSRIIITSRHLHVVSYIDPSSNPHQMKLMDIDKSWDLMKDRVFAQGHCPSEFEQLGRFIAEKCGGLPLAILVIAGILSGANQMQETWERVARNVNEAIKTGDANFTEILSLSYKHLPHHLRPCFLYMGGFPEDYEISVSKILKLWVAEGFLKPPDGSKHVEELVEEYLGDLIKRSLVFVSNRKSNGKPKAIKIHDMLRDLCLTKAQGEKFLQVISEFPLSLPDGVLNSRRLSAFAPVLGDFPDTDNSPIHTILIPLLDWRFDTWRCFKLLKILDAFTLEFTSFPAEICELFHLRYLAIAFQANDKFRIPQSLSNLRYLQTLIIMPSIFKVRLKGGLYLVPFRVWTLPQLRHLILYTFDFFDPWFGTSTALENLHTLARVASFTCSVKISKMVPNLKKLKIFYGPSDLYRTGWSKYQLNNLAHLHLLEKLSLHVGEPWQFIFGSPDFSLPALQRSDITFPKTLKKLTLIGCQLPWSDMTIVGSLPNLEVLKLKKRACCGDEWETSEGEFCRLKTLIIEESDLREWVTESCHFPWLQELHFYHCQQLSEIPSCIGDITTLELILLDYCSESMEESARSIEDEQRDYGNNELQVCIQRSARAGTVA